MMMQLQFHTMASDCSFPQSSCVLPHASCITHVLLVLLQLQSAPHLVGPWLAGAVACVVVHHVCRLWGVLLVCRAIVQK